MGAENGEKRKGVAAGKKGLGKAAGLREEKTRGKPRGKTETDNVLYREKSRVATRSFHFKFTFTGKGGHG